MELKLDNISIEGVFRSTIETYFNIKELKLCFDIGKCPFHITPVPNIFLPTCMEIMLMEFIIIFHIEIWQKWKMEEYITRRSSKRN